jgi:hypothetical protein
LFTCHSLITRMPPFNTVTPQPFRSRSSGHHSRHGRVATALPRTMLQEFCNTMSEPSLETPLAFPHQFYSGHSPTQRLLAPNKCYFHLTDHVRHRVANPEAALLPALVSVFGSKVTLLETLAESFKKRTAPGKSVSVRSGMCRLPAGHTFQPRTSRSRFPLTKPEA